MPTTSSPPSINWHHLSVGEATAIREGRTVFDNLRNVITWTLPTSGAEALIIVAAIAFGMTLPITPVQILWVNMITAVALGLTLAFDPAVPNVMTRPPRPPAAPVLSKGLLWQIAFVSLITVVATFSIFQWALTEGYSLETARTLVVNTLVLIEVVYLFHVRSIAGSTPKSAPLTRALLFGVTIVIGAQVLFTYLPSLQFIFGSAALAPSLVGVTLLAALTVGALMQLEFIAQRVGWR